MGSIPLPALAVEGPQVTDPQTLQLNAARLRAMQAENAMAPGNLQLQQQQIAANSIAAKVQQQELADDQKFRQAFAQAGGDWDKTVQFAQQQGVGPQYIAKAQVSHIKQQQDLANLTKDQQAAAKTKIDALGGEAQALLDAPEDQRQDLHTQARQRLIDAGHFQPNEIPEQVPDEDALKFTAAASMYAKDQMELANKKRETEQKDWKEFQALGLLVNTKTGEMKSVGGGSTMTPAMMESKYVALGQKQNQGLALTDDEKAFRKSYAQMKELVPAFNIRMATTGGGLGPAGNAGGGAAPAAAGSGGAAGAASSGSEPDLGRVPLQLRKQVEAVGHYRQPMPPQGRSNPVNTAVRQWVTELYPEYDETTYPARSKILSEYTKDASTGELGAINTALGHLGELYSAAQALSKNDLPFLHSIASKYGLATGGDAESTYNSILHRVGPEMTKAYLKGGGTEGERGANEDDFALAKGQKQIISNIAESAQLLNSKLASKKNAWDKTFLPVRDADQFDNRYITPDAKQTLQQLSSLAPTNRGKASGGHVISLNGKKYQYNGSGDTADLKNYTELK